MSATNTRVVNSSLFLPHLSSFTHAKSCDMAMGVMQIIDRGSTIGQAMSV